MTIFDRLDHMTSRIVDHHFATAFACTPMVSSPNGRSSPDPDRPPWEGLGVLSEEPASAGIEIGNRNRSGNDLRTLAAGTSYELSVDRTRHPAADSVRQADKIDIGVRSFRIASVRPDGLSRIVFGLTGGWSCEDGEGE